MTTLTDPAVRLRRRALVLACGRFDDPELPSLRSPGRDAVALERVLSGVDYEVTKVVDGTVQQARRAIAVFLEGARRTDVNLIYFSCHGIQDADGNLYFAFEDTQHRMPDVTAVAADFVRNRIGSSRSRSTIVLIDCCFSGAFLYGMRAKGSRDAGVGALVRDLPEGSGVAVLTSSGATEVSLEDPGNRDEAARRGSYFTEALLAGLLTGAADLDNDGRITVDELFSYTSDRVADGPSPQKPCKLVHAVGDMVVSKVGMRLREPPPPAPPPVAADTMLMDRVALPPWPPLPLSRPPAPVSVAPSRYAPAVYGTRRRRSRRLPAVIGAVTAAALAGVAAWSVAGRSDVTLVPTVVGLDRMVAEEQVRRAGLIPAPSPAPPGGAAPSCSGDEVTHQAPGPGSTVGPGTAVTLTFCAPIKVPDVLGQSRTSAGKELARAGFRVEEESVLRNDCKRNWVTTQRPKPGATALRDSTVVIEVCAGSPRATRVPTESPQTPSGAGYGE